jgi:hypothetical protein
VGRSFEAGSEGAEAGDRVVPRGVRDDAVGGVPEQQAERAAHGRVHGEFM